MLRVFTVGVVAQNVVGVAAFLAAYFFGIETPLTSYGGVRLSGMRLDANAYGGLLVLALIICEGASWGPEPLFSGPSLLFCRLSLGMGILFTFSRSTWVSLAIALLLLCIMRRGTAIRLALTAAAGAALFLLFMGGRFLQFFENMAARPEQGESRFELIRDALAEFARHPVFGGGLGSFLVSEGTIVHNTAVWFLAEFGILGLIVLVGYLASFLTMGWFAYRYAPPREKPLMLALLLGHGAMLGLSMGIEAFYQRHWWLVFALIGAGYSLARQQVGSRRTSTLRFAGGHQ
jgi:O-antigen ligase